MISPRRPRRLPYLRPTLAPLIVLKIVYLVSWAAR